MNERLTDEALSDDLLELLATGGSSRPWASQMARELLAHRRATPADDLRAADWEIPHVAARPDGYVCLAFIRGRWEQARYSATFGGWQIKEGGEFFQPDHFAPLPTRAALSQPAPAPQPADDLSEKRAKVLAVLEDAIGADAYDCNRVWEAWSAGTMRPCDFEPVLDRVDEIADAIVAALSHNGGAA